MKEANATFTKAKQDYDDGRLIYEVEFYCQNCKWEYDILASDGTILSRDYDGDCDNYGNGHHYGNGNGNGNGANASGLINTASAKSIAFQHAGVSTSAATNVKVELDYDDGRAEYEVEFRCNGIEYEYTIDAASGTILDYEWD